MATGEVYVQLAVNFADNRKVRKLTRFGRDARAIRDLYVQMVCYCKDNLSDGFVPADQIGILVYPDPEKIGLRDAGRLAEVELIAVVPGGWDVTGYLDRNPSKADVFRRAEAKAAGARMANHKRWHADEGISDPRCVLCRNTGRTSDQTTDGTSDPPSDSEAVGPGSGSESTETESKTESKTESEASDNARGEFELGSDDDPDFRAFWSAYPRRIGKGQARTAWRTAIRKRKADPKAIIAGAERFRDQCASARTDAQFIRHPSTWLNGECYDEIGDGTDDFAGDDDRWNTPWLN